MHSLQSIWEEFEQTCLMGVSGQQHREAKVAYWAGMMGLLRLQSRVGNSVTDLQRAEIIDGWSKEILQFRITTFPDEPQAKH